LAKAVKFSCGGFEHDIFRQGVTMDHGGWNEQKILRWYPLDQVENGNDGTFGGTHHFVCLSCVQESEQIGDKKRHDRGTIQYCP
jgi:hypothetical protein